MIVQDALIEPYMTVLKNDGSCLLIEGVVILGCVCLRQLIKELSYKRKRSLSLVGSDTFKAGKHHHRMLYLVSIE
jgi:hypothetical protein